MRSIDSVAKLVLGNWPRKALASERLSDGSWAHHGCYLARNHEERTRDWADAYENMPMPFWWKGGSDALD